MRLIEALIEGGHARDALARALVVTPSALETYRQGRARMPLEHQLLLARLVLERWPQTNRIRRAACALRSQVIAEMDFHARITKTHANPRVLPWGSLR